MEHFTLFRKYRLMFKVTDHVATKRSARTLAVDYKLHQVFLPAADFEKSTNDKERPKMIPGTFWHNCR